MYKSYRITCRAYNQTHSDSGILESIEEEWGYDIMQNYNTNILIRHIYGTYGIVYVMRMI